QLSQLMPEKEVLGFDKGYKSFIRMAGPEGEVLKIRAERRMFLGWIRAQPNSIMRSFRGGNYGQVVDPRGLFSGDTAFMHPSGNYSWGSAANGGPGQWVGMEWGAPHPLSYVPGGKQALAAPTMMTESQALRLGPRPGGLWVVNAVLMAYDYGTFI